MCGIAGYFCKAEVEDSHIHKTLNLMRNRGPDNQDFRIFRTSEKKNLLVCFIQDLALSIWIPDPINHLRSDPIPLFSMVKFTTIWNSVIHYTKKASFKHFLGYRSFAPLLPNLRGKMRGFP